MKSSDANEEVNTKKKVKKSKKSFKSFIVLLVSLFPYKISAWVDFYYLKNLCKICKINLYLLN